MKSNFDFLCAEWSGLADAAARSNLPRNHAVGIACNHGTAVACAADVSIENKRPRIHRVTVAVDCGLAVNPLTIDNQFQGGLVFGLTQLMAKGAITLNEGRVEQCPVPVISPAVVNTLARLNGRRYRSLPLVT